MGNPGKGLFSLASDIAFVTAFLCFKEVVVEFSHNDRVDEIREELVSLAQDASFDSVRNIAVLHLEIWRDDEMHGLDVAMCMPGVAVAAIF